MKDLKHAAVSVNSHQQQGSVLPQQVGTNTVVLCEFSLYIYGQVCACNLPQFPRMFHHIETENARTKVNILLGFVNVWFVNDFIPRQKSLRKEHSMNMCEERFHFTPWSVSSKKKLKLCFIIQICRFSYFLYSIYLLNWLNEKRTEPMWHVKDRGAFWPLGGVLSALAVIDRQGGGGKGLGSAAQGLLAYYHVQPVWEAKGTHTHIHINTHAARGTHAHTRMCI